MKEWNVHNIYKYTKHISWVCIDDEVFVIDEITGSVCILKNAQKDFWLLFDGSRSVLGIISEINSEDMDREEIEKKLYKFVEKMEAKNLIEEMLEYE